MKKIGIDARFFGPEAKGLGRYVQKLIQYLEKIDASSDRHYYIFLRKEQFEKYIPVAGNFTKVLADYQWYTFEEQFKYPLFLNQYKLDLIHFCHFNVPLLYRRPFVVTIHDLILLHYPTIRNTTLHRYYYTVKLFAYEKVIRSAARRAQRIITVSEFTSNDIVKNLFIPEEKLAVTLEGCEMNFSQELPANSLEIYEKYKIKKPYLLYVGNAYPHKNLETLCRAFTIVLEKFSNLQLVLAGGKDFFYQRLEKYIEDNDLKNIILTGYVNDFELEVIYRGAEAFVFPSLYEGFGLPPLEAMTKNIPVVSSDRTSMPEILGDAALYFDPEDVSAMAIQLERLLSEERLQEELKVRGKKRGELFNWETMARQTLEIYKSIV
jgi:glycosyltransferase involved in cell wall biosynthesis